MMPVLTVIFRILLLDWSATKIFPELSTAIPRGKLTCAEVAAVPSPLKPFLPVPATNVMKPVLAVTFKITWPFDATKKFPATSIATPIVRFSFAAVAAISYTLGSADEPCDPATVLMIPDNVKLLVCTALPPPILVALVFNDVIALVEEDTTSNKINSRRALTRVILDTRKVGIILGADAGDCRNLALCSCF